MLNKLYADRMALLGESAFEVLAKQKPWKPRKSILFILKCVVLILIQSEKHCRGCKKALDDAIPIVLRLSAPEGSHL